MLNLWHSSLELPHVPVVAMLSQRRHKNSELSLCREVLECCHLQLV